MLQQGRSKFLIKWSLVHFCTCAKKKVKVETKNQSGFKQSHVSSVIVSVHWRTHYFFLGSGALVPRFRPTHLKNLHITQNSHIGPTKNLLINFLSPSLLKKPI